MRRYRALAMAVIGLALLSACRFGTNPSEAVSTPPAIPGTPGAATAPQHVTAASGDIVTITFGAREYERPAYEPLITTFNQQNPGIHVQFVALDTFVRSVEGRPVAPAETMRRIASAADTATAWFVRPEDMKELLRDLAPLMDADPDFEPGDFYPGALDMFRLNGGIFMLPRSLRVPLLSYNKDLWAARGLPAPRPDWTWNDLKAAAEQLAQKRGDDVVVYGLLDWGSGIAALFGELAASDVNLFATPPDQMRLDRPEIASALERVAALARSGALYLKPHEPGEPANDDEQKLILEGRAAIWPRGMLFAGPDNASPTFAIGTAPDPRAPLPFSDDTAGYTMSSGTRHPQEAWRWLSFLSKQEVRSPVEPAGSLSELPARKSVAERSGYWSKLDAGTVAAIKAVVARPAAPLPAGAFDSRILEPLNQALNAVVSGKQRAAQALREAQAELSQQLAQAQGTPSPTPERGPVVVATPVVEAAPEGATTISFGAFEYQADEMRRVVRAFNQSDQGIFVQLKNNDPARGLADAAAASDCFTWWSPPEKDEITATLDLQPLIDADAGAQGETPIRDDYPPALLAPFRQGGGLYGLPYAVELRVLTYNKEAFDAAGLSYPTAAWTPDDFLNAAQKLTSDSDGGRRYGYATMGSTASDLIYFVDRFGASLALGRGDAVRPNFTDPKVIKAARFYVTLLRDYSPHKGLMGFGENNTLDVSWELFSTGRIGMWFSDTPRIYEGWARTKPFTKMIAPPPLNGPPAPEDVRPNGLFISAGTQQAQACWQWLKYLSKSPAALGPDVPRFPARISVAESDAFLKQVPDGAAEVVKAYRAALARTDMMGVREPYYRSKLNDYWFFRAVDRALHGKDLERELADAQALTEQYLACTRSGGQADACAKQVDPGYGG